MRPSEMSAALATLLRSGRPLYVWGPPGVGKSSVVRKSAEALSLEVVDLRATLLDPVDLRGLPRVVDDSAVWCPPAFLPRGGEGILFLDELAQAPPLVQAACLQLVLDRKLGEYELPQGWCVVAASNRSDDRAGTHRLISPLLNRFVHLDLEVSADDWQYWAVAANVAAEVRAFVRFRPGLLFQFDPSANPRAFPTPRSWHAVSDVLAKTPPHLLHAVAAGCVGDGPAAEFASFLTLYRELPDVDAVLKSPDSSPVPREPAVLYALVGALVEKCRANHAPLANFVRYANRLRRAAGAVADLRARAREAVAGELSKIVADAVRDVVAAVLRAGPEPVRSDARDRRDDDEYDPWDDDEAEDYDHEPRTGAKPVGRNDSQNPTRPPSAAPAAVTAGLAAGRWWLGRRGSVAEAVGVGILVALAALAGGPTARTGAAVAAAVADLSATADALGSGRPNSF